MEIRAGDTVEVTTALNEQLVMRALGGPTPGLDFTVVWVATPDEYEAAQAEGRDPDGIPWPVTALRAVATQ